MSALSSSIWPKKNWNECGSDAPQEAFSAAALLKAASSFQGKETADAMKELLGFSRTLSVASSLDVLAAEIAKRAVEILRVTYCRVLVTTPNHALSCVATYDSRVNVAGFESKVVPVASMRLYQRAATNLSPLVFRMSSPTLSHNEQHLLGAENVAGLCLAPMRLNAESIGLLVLGLTVEQEGETHLEEKRRLIAYLAEQAAAALYRVNLSRRLQASQLETVLALAKALEARDDHTAGHGQRMVELAERIALRLGCTPAELETIRWAALLHDIGKLGIPDRILLKQGPLTPEEWVIMRRHPQIGAEIVNRVSNLADVTELIQDHHERWDGQGYPRQKMGEEIPLGARIVAVVDVYSAMTDGRCYRLPCTHAEAVQELKRCSGSNFDPGVVEAFISLYR